MGIMTIITSHIKKITNQQFVGTTGDGPAYVNFFRLDWWLLEPHCSKQSFQTEALYFVLRKWFEPRSNIP